MIITWIGALVITVGVSAVVTMIVVRYGKRWGIMDDPATHKHEKVTHKIAIPRGGGVPIFVAVMAGIALFVGWNLKMVGLVVGIGILTVWGIVDDKFEEKISPHLRLIFGNVAAALCVIGVGIGIAYINNPLGGIVRLDTWRWCWQGHCIVIWADIFALIWLVAMQNIVGWSSGVDGQLPGFVVVAAITMAAIAIKLGGDPMLAIIVAGAYLGFLPWNWYPQKIMPGFGGKAQAGFLLGVLAILTGAKVGAMVLVLGIPFIDGVMVIVKRLREHRSPFMGGREHLHHWLLQLGWGRRRIAVFYWAVSAVLGLAVQTLQPQTKLFTMAMITLICGGLILWLQLWLTSSKQPDRDSG